MATKLEDANIVWSVAQARSMIDAEPDNLFQPANDDWITALDQAQGDARISGEVQFIVIAVRP